MKMLYIAAKSPLAGNVKTRLGPALGEAGAADLYRSFLRDLACRFANAPFPVSWFVEPGSWPEIAGVVGDGWSGVVEQGPGDWSERQSALFRGAFARGEQPVVLIASDSPQLPADEIVRAFDLLERRDVVLGPVLDGGYYLIGLREWHDVLDGIGMSTSAVLDEIVTRSRGLGLSLALLEPTFDVDVAADLPLLRRATQERADLSWTAAALNELTGRSA